MSKTVFCAKLQEEAPALAKPPFPGATGERIYAHISQKAWEMWLAHQTMLINEYRLNTLDAKAREFLSKEREKFLFGEGSDRPSGYVPPKD